MGGLATTPSFGDLAGTTLATTGVVARRGGRKLATKHGGLMFTHAGVSGPVILEVSLELARVSEQPEEVRGTELLVDLCPEMSREAMMGWLAEAAQKGPRRILQNVGLSGALSSRLLGALATAAGIDPTRRVGQMSRKEFATLTETLKGLRLVVEAMPDVREGMITVGGVAAEGLEPKTLESRSVAGLSFAGELLGLAGPCGGFNLLVAFATGTAAGRGRSARTGG